MWEGGKGGRGGKGGGGVKGGATAPPPLAGQLLIIYFKNYKIIHILGEYVCANYGANVVNFQGQNPWPPLGGLQRPPEPQLVAMEKKYTPEVSRLSGFHCTT